MQVTEVVRPYRGVSAEVRRGDRRERLLEACLDVVAAVGVNDTTVDAICAQAGLSKRYFYESFPDREAALVAALDLVFDAVRAAIAGVLAEGAPTDRVSRTVSVLVKTLAADERAARLYIEAPRHPALEERRIAAFDEFTQLLVQYVLDLDGDDPAARAATLLVVAGTTEVLSRWLAGDIDLDEDELVQTISGVGLAVAQSFAQSFPRAAQAAKKARRKPAR